MADHAEEILELVAGDARATVHPADGGRLGQLTVAGRRLLRGPEDGAHLGWGWWGCYPLLPWSNRIPGGRFEHRGRALQVPVTWSDGTALHGLTAWVPWTATSASATAVEETVEVEEGPYRVRGQQHFSLEADHLQLVLEVTNLADEEVPVGLGIHPWFVAGPVRVPASQAWPGEPLPDGPPRPVTAEEDLRERRVPPPMDRCYTGLEGATVEVPGLRLEWSGPVTQVVVYSADPGWICVEPVTMANDGFRLAAEGVDGHGVLALGPGESASVAYRFVWGD